MARGGVFGTTVNRGDAPMIPTNGFGDFRFPGSGFRYLRCFIWKRKIRQGR
ncbi:MAG: hypothetical protein ACLUD2_04710 [Clostridium sp.]